jgi:hypothetical protein
MALTKKEIKNMRERIEAELEDLGKEMKMEFKVGNASFSANSVTFKLIASTVTLSGVVMTPEVDAWKRNARVFGLDPEDLGANILLNGKLMKFAGLKPSNRKYPVLVEDAQGKTYKIDEGTAQFARQRYVAREEYS